MARYELSCTMHFMNEIDRDEVFNLLQLKKALIDTSLSGFIEKHLCRHDEGQSCENVVRESWGVVNE